MMHRLWELLLGLDKGFLARDGELHSHFSPAWPKTPLIQAGALNWLLAILAVAGLAVLLRRRTSMRSAFGRRTLRVLGLVVLYVFLLSLLSGAAAWNVVLGATGAILIFQVYRQ